MKKISLHTLVAICFTFLSGCTWNFWCKDFVTPSNKLGAPHFELLSLGMTKAQVISYIGQPDQVIGSRMEGTKVVETWEYQRVAATPGPDQIAERYQVKFTDGRLSSYDSSGDFRQQINIRY